MKELIFHINVTIEIVGPKTSPMVRQTDTTRYLNGFFLHILRRIVNLAARPTD